MFNFWNRHKSEKAKPFFSSRLHNENNFYKAFLQDLESCQKEVIIESPYMTASRMEMFYHVFEKLMCKGVKVSIITRDPIDQNILWEGSLNILSQTRSQEIMRRIESKDLALEMFNFLKLEKYL